MYVDKETTIAEVDLGEYALKFEGILDESDWEVTMTFKNDLMPSKSYKIDNYCWSTDEVEEMVWAEVMRLTQKYTAVVFSDGLTEVEVDDEEDEE
jgi:hypothetical protein